MLLPEYCLMPSLFDVQSYGKPHWEDKERREIYKLYFELMIQTLLSEGIIRDLYAGSWSKLVASKNKDLQKLLKKYERRIRPVEKVSDNRPNEDTDWLSEAIESCNRKPASGIIAPKFLIDSATPEVRSDAIFAIEAIETLHRSELWKARSCSIRLKKNIDEYLTQLEPILKLSNKILFVDPYLNPKKNQYRDFHRILAAITKRPRPKIQVHVAQVHDRDRGRQITSEEYERDFREVLTQIIQEQGLEIKVFFWDDFHDRYLLSDLLDINLAHGFAISGSRPTIWTRVGKKDAISVRDEFDKKKSDFHLLHDFTVS